MRFSSTVWVLAVGAVGLAVLAQRVSAAPVGDPAARTAQALAEARRVVKPGGRLVVVEFSSPTFAPFRAIYMNYLMRALPFIARKTSSNPDAYIYLADSIRAWPNQKALAAQIVDAGWTQVGWKNLTGGVVAIHMAVAP
jgi:demethylmenaquinone methyltransferase/2-methoxy-6-polyprenyl-1,4-benzoquinol methylase